MGVVYLERSLKIALALNIGSLNRCIFVTLLYFHPNFYVSLLKTRQYWVVKTLMYGDNFNYIFSQNMSTDAHKLCATVVKTHYHLFIYLPFWCLYLWGFVSVIIKNLIVVIIKHINIGIYNILNIIIL